MGHAERLGEDFTERKDEDGQPRREQCRAVRAEHVGGDGARYGGPGRVRHRIEREDGGDGLINVGTELVEYLARSGPLLAQVFDIGPGDGVEGRFGHGADRGNQHHEKDGEQQSDHERDLAGPPARAVERDMAYGSVALTGAESNALVRRKGRRNARSGAREPFRNVFRKEKKTEKRLKRARKPLTLQTSLYRYAFPHLMWVIPVRQGRVDALSILLCRSSGRL